MSLTLRKQRPPKRYAKMAPLATDARDTAARYASTTRVWAAPKAVAAKDWAAPKVEPAVEKVKEDVLPVVAGAVTAALAASEPVRHEAASRGSAALAALKGEIEAPKPKKHRLRKLFLLATVLGAAYAGWKAWASSKGGSDPVDAWKTPSPTPYAGGTAFSSTSTGGTAPSSTSTGPVSPVAPVAPVDTPTTDDPGGAGPDEALADAADEALANQGGEGSPFAESPADQATTEAVTPSQAKKTSDAAAKGPKHSNS